MKLVTRNFIVKIAGACNLNCSYCYMYNMGDTSFLTKPKVMHQEIALQTLKKIYEYTERNSISEITLVLHGGEPLLVGRKWMEWYLESINQLAPEGLKVNISLQTNGTLIDVEWITLFKQYNVSFGISIDGPPEAHDRFRVDHAGRGSYAQVRRAIELLVRLGKEAPKWGVLIVANPEHSSVEVYNHLLELGVKRMDFLWPDYHYNQPPPWPKGSLAQYYKSLFDIWYRNKDLSIEIRWFENAIRLLLSGETKLDALGPQALTELVIETDGSIEPLDALRTCKDSMTRIGLNVSSNNIEDIYETELFKMCLHNQSLLPDQCHTCPVYEACGAGYMPHRWSDERGFQNTSIHCLDLYETLSHIKNSMIHDFKTASFEHY